jgi:LytS/YehU family sensor histidine kinase
MNNMERGMVISPCIFKGLPITSGIFKLSITRKTAITSTMRGGLTIGSLNILCCKKKQSRKNIPCSYIINI